VAVRPGDLVDLAVEVRASLKEVEHPEEVLLRGVELVGRVDHGSFAEEEESRQLAGFQNGALAVLTGDHEADLEGGPLPLMLSVVLVVEGLFLDRAGLLDEPSLPGVKFQASQGG